MFSQERVVEEPVSMSVYFFLMITEKVCMLEIEETLVCDELLVKKEYSVL